MTSPLTVHRAAPIRVTVWGENFHENSERDRDMMARLYPEGMHGAIAAGLRELLGDLRFVGGIAAVLDGVGVDRVAEHAEITDERRLGSAR